MNNDILLASQNVKTITRNLQVVAQHAHNGRSHFRVVRIHKDNDAPQYVIRTNGILRKLFFRLYPNKEKIQLKLQALVNSHVEYLKTANKNWFINEDQTYTNLFFAAQKFNQSKAMSERHAKELPIFREVGLEQFIDHAEIRELLPLKVASVAQETLQDIPSEQLPHVERKGWFKKHNLYYYNPEDAKISHGREAGRIFLNTQTERIASVFGRAIEKLGSLFGKEITNFKNRHYFRRNEQKNPDEIYRQDAPMAHIDQPTSYWVGHATCLLRVPLTSQNGKKIPVNVVTDPVEGDLNKILYPRMTNPARKVEEYPAIHVYLLSHNHLDHFNTATIKKLLSQQPVMIVPENDAAKYRKLGFKNVHECNWWQTASVKFMQDEEEVEMNITAVPAHHWSGQGPCDGHHSAFLGFVIHGDQRGDIYFAGDTARLSEDHVKTLRERFNIRAMFQPGGPDEVRKDMESTHQASVDGLWMHFNLLVKKLYEDHAEGQSKAEFIEETKKLLTVYMHTKTFKLGNLHYDDTDKSVQLVLDALNDNEDIVLLESMKSYEKQVFDELMAMGQEMRFGDEVLEPNEIAEILQASVKIPKIGERTTLIKQEG